MRSRFDMELEQLNTELIEMGNMVESAINAAANGIIQQNPAIANEAYEIEREIDRQEREIENHCMKLLLLNQPVASDLRLISTALKMITDMERIGDQAADIAELCVHLSKQPFIKKLDHISQMAKATIKMVKDSVDAFIGRDLELAKSVIAADDEVDDLYNQVKHDLLGLIQEDTHNGEQAVDLLSIAKYLERIGDHATNIAEWVMFAITGRHVKEEHNS
ncbi:phosphate signaling complex protein PhoU [Paludicola sp. MB14-C6]|uniref:phosphate signaling complex protein PhoU n=1 Tax=Paludihabitans sp. MB14-C6 TaxID=3070656 RepID=UPI0027DE467F|nr:phosphate signaling complex protein PhoU [Paludicola sp. MB14-C6]WMJ24419.1 phosphate signaling complex protein PhoU [Paludicola sp. MB14-C6]